jgi:hypothetical protein
MTDVLRKGTALTLADQDRAAAIIQHSKLEVWLSSQPSSMLFVNGSSRRHENISPLSFACAILAYALVQAPPIITLTWFCGLHAEDSKADTIAMMRSLSCQLLAAYPRFQFRYSASQYRSQLDEQPLKMLLGLFTELIQQLSSTAAVFCIIDGISYYEGRNQCDGVSACIRKLVKLANRDEPIFKLLVTSPTRMTYVHQQRGVESESILDIPQHVNGSKQGFNSKAIASNTEERARRLSETLVAINDV